MNQLIFKYGSGRVDLKVKDATWVAPLTFREMQPITDIGAAFLRAMFQCIGSPPLRAMLSPDDLITIVISDDGHTRAQQQIVLSYLLNNLAALGLPYENIAILVARGARPPLDKEELQKLVLPSFFSLVKVENHEADDTTLVTLGTTSRGTPVRVNLLCTQPRKVILLSAVYYDIMSGYSGGPRAIMPGVCSMDGILKNNSLALSPNAPCSHPRVGPGIIAHNPVCEDAMEACGMVNPVFSIHLVGDIQGRLCGIFAGHWRDAWLQSTRMVMSYAGASIPLPGDIALASCGGYPMDSDLMKAAYGIVCAARCVRNAGTLAVLAECRDGNGPEEFFQWVQSRNRGTLVQDLRDHFTQEGYLFFALYEVTRRIRVMMLSKNVTTTTLRDVGIQGFRTIETLASHINFSGANIYTLSDSCYTVPYAGN